MKAHQANTTPGANPQRNASVGVSEARQLAGLERVDLVAQELSKGHAAGRGVFLLGPGSSDLSVRVEVDLAIKAESGRGAIAKHTTHGLAEPPPLVFERVRRA